MCAILVDMSSAWKVKDRGRNLALNTVCSRKSVAPERCKCCGSIAPDAGYDCAEKELLGLLTLRNGGFHEWIMTPGYILAIELAEARFTCSHYLGLHERRLVFWLLHDKDVR